MDVFFAMALKPFVAFLMLLPAWFVKRWMERNMRDSPLKRLLLTRRGDSMEAWCHRQDDRFHAFLGRLFRRLIGRRP